MNDYGNSRKEDELLKISEELQNEVEEKDRQIADLQKQLQTSVPSLTVSMLKNKLQEQAQEIVRLNGTIESQNEWIGKMSESDLIVKDNEKLRAENKELIRQKELADRKAEEKVNAIKQEYSDAINNANVREKKADEKEEYYNNLIIHEKERIEQTAKEKVADKITELELQYKITVGANKGFWGMILMFSIVLIVMLALKNEVFLNDLINAMTYIGEVFDKYISGYSDGAGNVIGMIVLTAFIVGIIFVCLYFYTSYLDDNDIEMFDRITAVYSFLSLSVILFAGENIRENVNINLIRLYILLFVIYLVVRSVIQMKDHDVRKTLIINVVSMVIMFGVLIWGLRSCMISIGELTK